MKKSHQQKLAETGLIETADDARAQYFQESNGVNQEWKQETITRLLKRIEGLREENTTLWKAITDRDGVIREQSVLIDELLRFKQKVIDDLDRLIGKSKNPMDTEAARLGVGEQE